MKRRDWPAVRDSCIWLFGILLFGAIASKLYIAGKILELHFT